MKRNQFAFVCIVLVAVLGLVQGCSRGPSEEDLKFAAFQEQFAALQPEYDALLILRTEIEAADLALVELQAIPEKNSPTNKKPRSKNFKPGSRPNLGRGKPPSRWSRASLPIFSTSALTTIRKPRRPRLIGDLRR